MDKERAILLELETDIKVPYRITVSIVANLEASSDVGSEFACAHVARDSYCTEAPE